jgi:nucleotide-binding universal stress UspA family protein
MNTNPTRNPGGVVLEPGPEVQAPPMVHAETEKAGLSLLKIRRILVPIDFSSCSKKALQYAIPFAKQYRARLCLLYVGQGYYLVPELAPTDLNTYKMSERADLAAKLASFATKEIPSSLAVDILVRNGQPALEIVDVAKENGADLIIISTHGYGGLKHLWFGSIAEQVVRHATCPVLVVENPNTSFSPENFAPKLRRFKSSVYRIDVQKTSQALDSNRRANSTSFRP